MGRVMLDAVIEGAKIGVMVFSAFVTVIASLAAMLWGIVRAEEWWWDWKNRPPRD